MDDRILDLTEAQQAIKSKYPPINKKYLSLPKLTQLYELKSHIYRLHFVYLSL